MGRRRSKSYIRKTNRRAERKRILIYCEGKNTEPQYFRHFKLTSVDVEAIGRGENTLSLVEATAKHVERKGKTYYEEIWCVFDKDDFPADNFDNAVRKAESKGYRVAYSNQAFEYWLILHFEAHAGGAMARSDYAAKLNSYLEPLGLSWDPKGKGVSKGLFEALLVKENEKERQVLAMERAKRIHADCADQACSAQESVTTVYELVERLRE